MYYFCLDIQYKFALMQKVFKFGGASIKDAQAFYNLAAILKPFKGEKLMVVVSALGTQTNALEAVLAKVRLQAGSDIGLMIQQLVDTHFSLAKELFLDDKHPVFDDLGELFQQLIIQLQRTDLPYDSHYDQTVSFGELVSSCMVYHFLNQQEIRTHLLDARSLIATSTDYRAAQIDWELTAQNTASRTQGIDADIILTQGFIGRAPNGLTTTLGREGSDFTAAILAYCLNAQEVTIWKDVPGLLNADPKRFADTQKIDHISYAEAIELAYYGATVIHPKTIKPLQNKNIPLMVRSFLHPEIQPTLINQFDETKQHIPSIIVKDQQVLVSIGSRDFSFMNEESLSFIFGVLSKLHIHINVMQTSALSLSVCFDLEQHKLSALLDALHATYKVRFNEGLQLITIRHYSPDQELPLIAGKMVYLEQKSRTTLQLVVKA
jgi:aspartate kinase